MIVLTAQEVLSKNTNVFVYADISRIHRNLVNFAALATPVHVYCIRKTALESKDLSPSGLLECDMNTILLLYIGIECIRYYDV